MLRNSIWTQFEALEDRQRKRMSCTEALRLLAGTVLACRGQRSDASSDAFHLGATATGTSTRVLRLSDATNSMFGRVSSRWGLTNRRIMALSREKGEKGSVIGSVMTCCHFANADELRGSGAPAKLKCVRERRRGQGLENRITRRSSSRSSMPKIPVKRPVLDCFQDRLNSFAPGEIGNRACDLENAVICPGAQMKLFRGVTKEFPTLGVQFAISFLARNTRSRMASDDSARSSLLSSLYSTAGASTWMSIRSSSGPEIRLRQFSTCFGEQRHSGLGSSNILKQIGPTSAERSSGQSPGLSSRDAGASGRGCVDVQKSSLVSETGDRGVRRQLAHCPRGLSL